MTVLIYLALIACGFIVGATAGGILGKLSIGKANLGLAMVLGSAVFFQWLGYLSINYLKFQTGNSIPLLVYCIVVILFALISFSGARGKSS